MPSRRTYLHLRLPTAGHYVSRSALVSTLQNSTRVLPDADVHAMHLHQVVRGYFELTRLHKPFMGNTLMFWPCGTSPAARHPCIASQKSHPPFLTFIFSLLLYAVWTSNIDRFTCCTARRTHARDPSRIRLASRLRTTRRTHWNFAISQWQAWGLTIAARTTALPLALYAEKLLWFAVGSMLVHSAACVLNDICDVDFDRQVERTKDRPLPAGVVSMRGAAALCAALLAPALYILAHCDTLGIAMAMVGVFPLHALYPLMKRWTWWPQAWLGLAFNWGIPVAWISVTGTLPPPALWVLFAGGVCWTILYDTIYACQDRADDARVGIKSTALLFGTRIRPALASLAALLLLCLACSGRALGGVGAGYAVLSCGGALAHTGWQLASWDERDSRDHRAKFESNGLLGCVIWLGMVLDYVRVLYPAMQ
ncbi:UbiA prenyltransferase family-domain-containing protein [Earliella scabrosa]|nr:UbiA prenyltransferase family-domain-containing protein [Earliella scabrosa]